MANYKLTYFDARGLAEPSRWIFAYTGVAFEDVRIALGALTPEKKEELGLIYGQLPILEIDGQQFSQSRAIARYLARKYNLMGKDEIEAFHCDEIIDAVTDFTNLWVGMFRETDEKKKEEIRQKLVETDTPTHFTKFNKFIERNGTKWSVGDQFSLADIYLAHFSTHFEKSFDVDLNLKNYPALHKLVENVQALPAIKKWLETRPETKF